MAATIYTTYDDFFANTIYLLGALSESLPTIEFIYAERVLNPGWSLTTLSTAQKHDILRLLTAMTVALRPDMNCWPRGEAELLCFDLDGNPIP